MTKEELIYCYEKKLKIKLVSKSEGGRRLINFPAGKRGWGYLSDISYKRIRVSSCNIKTSLLFFSPTPNGLAESGAFNYNDCEFFGLSNGVQLKLFGEKNE